MLLNRLMLVSDALDSENGEAVFKAVENLMIPAEDLENYQSSLISIIHRFVHLDLLSRKDEAKKALHVLLSQISDSNLRDVCTDLIINQTPICSTVASTVLISRNIQLSPEVCKELAHSIEKAEVDNFEHENLIEWVQRIGMTCRVFRYSSFSRNQTRKVLLGSLEKVLSLLQKMQSERKFSKIKLPVEFATELMDLAPGHPILEMGDAAQTSSDPNNECCFVPRVESVEYHLENAISEFSNVLSSEKIYNDENAFEYLNLFQRLQQSLPSLDLTTRHITILAKFWKSAFRLTNAIDLPSTQKMTVQFKMNVELLDAKLRALFLKHLLRLIADDDTINVAYEPQIAALVIDTYRRDIRVPEFQAELGEFWTVVYSLKYDNIYNSTAFYSALMALAKTQALFRIKKELCKEVLNTILKPIYDQMVDFKKMKKVEETRRGKTLSPMEEQEDLGSELFEMISFSYEDAKSSIEKFLNE